MKILIFVQFCFLSLFSLGVFAQTHDNDATSVPSINSKTVTDATPSENLKDASKNTVKSTNDATSSDTSDSTVTSTTTVTTTKTVSSTPIEVVVVKKIMPDYKVPKESDRLSPKGPNAVTASLGIKSGLTDNSTGGFMPSVGYAYQLSSVMWFDSDFSVNFGGDCSKDEKFGGYVCGGLNGFGLTMLGGLMWRFLDQPAWKIPLNPYVRLLTGITFIISNGPNDGFAFVARGAGGARYSFTDDFAVGAEMGLTIGPSFRNELSMGAFASIDFSVSVEYSF